MSAEASSEPRHPGNPRLTSSSSFHSRRDSRIDMNTKTLGQFSGGFFCCSRCPALSDEDLQASLHLRPFVIQNAVINAVPVASGPGKCVLPQNSFLFRANPQ